MISHQLSLKHVIRIRIRNQIFHLFPLAEVCFCFFPGLAALILEEICEDISMTL